MDPIRIRTPSVAHAQRLVAALDGGFKSSALADGDGHSDGDGDGRGTIALLVDSKTADKLVELFDLLGRWLAENELQAVQIGFGERTYTLLAPTDGEIGNPTEFLLERTIQLQTALESRVVIEQAKGIVAERESIDPEAAFDRIRREARARRIKLHVLAAGIVGTVAQIDGHQPGSEISRR
jgi:ANTAR domain-containing protein